MSDRFLCVRRATGRGRYAAAQSFLLCLVWIIAVSACNTATTVDAPFVDLTNRQPVPAAVAAVNDPVRMAVAAVLSPEGNVDSYAGLARYLGDRLGRPVEIVQRRTYAEVNDLVAGGLVDLAFVCTSAYIAGSERGEMELLVVPEVGAERVYHSAIIVPFDSRVGTFEDLKGAVFAFTDPMSNTGRVYPTHLVMQLGHAPESFFTSVFFTYSHDKAIEAVAQGIADGAAVDDLVLTQAFSLDAGLSSRVRVIHRSPPFGIPPIVVPSQSAPEFREELRALLLDLDTDPAGHAILDRLGIDRFVIGDDRDYDSAREMVDATGLGV